MHWTAAQTASCVAGEATSFFAHDGGIQAIAANGPLSLQAHTGALEVLADAAMTVTSVQDAIEVKASKVVTLQAGQTSVTLEDRDITFACPGHFSVKGAQHPFSGGASAASQIEAMPAGLVERKNWIALDYRDADGDPMADVGYRITFAGGAVVSGKLGRDGAARHENVPDKPVNVEYDARVPDPEKPWSPLLELVAKAESKFPG